MSNQSGLSPYFSGPFTDTGTGAHDGPPSAVTYGAEHDPEPTGAVEGPPPSVTVESPPEHLSEPTSAHPNPPASVTSYQWPATDPAEQPQPETKAVQEAENKAVTGAATKGTRGAGKRGK